MCSDSGQCQSCNLYPTSVCVCAYEYAHVRVCMLQASICTAHTKYVSGCILCTRSGMPSYELSQMCGSWKLWTLISSKILSMCAKLGGPFVKGEMVKLATPSQALVAKLVKGAKAKSR